MLDGVEEKSKIVTVATTNCLETLDKALSQRPSRFDRVIKLLRPSLEQRLELVRRLCQKIPLDSASQEYIAAKAENCTPAQLQEIIFSLVIMQSDEFPETPPMTLHISKDDIEAVILKIKGKYGNHLGFTIRNNHNGEHVDMIEKIKN